MSAPGTPKASQAAITAVQEALAAHTILRGKFDSTGRPSCGECGAVYESPARWDEHRARAAADAAAPHNAAQALRDAADDKTLRLGGHSGVSVRGLRDRADRLEAGQ